MADNLFGPNQLGTPSIVFNPMRATLDANQFKITSLPAPTSAADAANKAYVDASVGPGGGAANWANNPAVNNVNMNGFGINSATTIVSSGDITASGNSLITTAGQVATNTSAIATKAPSANPTFTGSVSVPAPTNPTDAATKAYVDANIGVNILPLNNTFTGTNAFNGSDFTVGTAATPISDTFEIHAQDVNLRSHGTTDILNITSAAGVVVAAGGAVNITGGASSSMYAALGTVGIGGPINHIIVDGADIEDVVNLTASGTISGNVISGTTSVSAPTVSATTITATGNISGNNIGATNTVSAAGVNCSGGIQGATLGLTGNMTTNAGTIRTLGGSIIASGTAAGQGVIEGAVKAVAPLGDFDSVFTAQIQLGNNAGVNELTLIGNDPTSKVITAIQEGGVGTPGGVVDTRINPITASLAGSTLSIGAKNGVGAATTMASVDLSGLTPDPLFSQFLSLVAPAGTPYNLTAGQMNSAIDFEVSTTGSLTVNLPNNVAPGSAVFIKLNGEISAPGTNIFLTPPGVAVGAPPSVNIRSNGGCFAVAMGEKAGDTQYAMSESFAYFSALQDYLPLVGGTLSGKLTVEETTNIEAKNITTALLTPLPSVGFISALGPLQVEGGNFLVANSAGSEIGLAASASPPVGQVATITYNYSTDDLLHVNKSIEAPGAVLDGNDVVPLLTFKDARTFYVSKQGLDTNSGAINAPFLTVSAAVAAAITAGNAAVVQVGPGLFTANFSIDGPAGIVIQGAVVNDRCVEGTQLDGQITVSITGVDNLQNNQVVISNMLITGTILDQSSKQHTLIISNCRIEADSALGAVAIASNQTATDGRLFIQDCVITQETGSTGSNALIACNVGNLYLQRCDISVKTTGACVSLSGSANLTNMNNCGLASSASATTTELIKFGPSVAKTHNIGYSFFSYSAATAKPSAAGIRFVSASQTLLIVNTLFSLIGLTNAVAFDSGCNPVLVVGNNRAVASTGSTVQSGAVLSATSLIGETSVNTLNSLSNAVVLAAGTNVSLATVGNTITINATAGSGGITSVNSQTGPGITVAAGTGVGVATAANTITVSNSGVLSVGVGTGLVNSGSASAPVIAFSGTGTATFQDINAVKLDTTGTGADFSAFAVYPRVSGAYVAPTEPAQLVPLQYVDDNVGVQSVAAGDASITIGGTAADPTVAVAASGVAAGSYSYTSLTVGADGRLSAAASGVAPITTTVNANSGNVILQAGTNMSLDETTPGTIIFNATGGGGGGSVDSVSGTAQQIVVSPTTGATVVSLAAFGAGEATYNIGGGSVGVDDYGRVISIVGSSPTTVNTLSGAVVLAAGTNVALATVGNTITINASGGGGGGITEIGAGNGISVDATIPTAPVVSVATTGVSAGSYVAPNIEVNARGQITFISNGSYGQVNTVVGSAFIGVDADTNPAAPVISLTSIGGNASAPIQMQANELTSDTYMQGLSMFATNGYVGHWEGPGSGGNKWAIPTQDADGPGETSLRIVKLQPDLTEVAGTSSVLYSERYNPLITTPFATGPSTVAPIGTLINNSGVSIVSGVIALNYQNWPTLQTGYFGILGNISLITATSAPLRFTITGQITGKAAMTFVGQYVSEGQYHTVPLNNISFGFGANGQIAQGDTLTITVSAATIVSLATTTIATAVPVLPIVLSPLTMAV